MFILNEVVVRLNDRKMFTVIGTPADTRMINTNEPAYLLKDRYDDHMVVPKTSMEDGRYESHSRKYAHGQTKVVAHVDDGAFHPMPA